jgi:riboflavin synthase
MYTGITQGLFPVVNLVKEKNLLKYGVKLNSKLLQGLEIGASVSVDGVCQTVIAIQSDVVFFNAIEETCLKTTLSTLTQGRMVSIERSASYGVEIGGHAMYGHVYGTGEIIERRQWENNLELVCYCGPQMIQYVFEKGFISVDGSSLTVNKVDLQRNCFAINLIPHTLEVTNFSKKQVGDKVNIEVDANTLTIVETIKRLQLNLVVSTKCSINE